MPKLSFASSSRRIPPCARLWILTAVVSCLFANAAHTQSFHFNLEQGRKLHEEFFGERAVWDTVGTVDLTTITLGEYYKLPHFLQSKVKRTQELVRYDEISGYKVTYSIPRDYSFDLLSGEEVAPDSLQPHVLPVTDIDIGFEKFEDVAGQTRHQSRRNSWRDVVVASVTGQKLVRGPRKGRINVAIPLPMPRQLESIFGPGEKTHINISGRESITFAGESRRVNPFRGAEGQQSQSLFPSLDMKQELDVTLTGTIGDKVNIRVDHSSQAISDDANRIQVNYVGYEDDVVKRIDLGNTSLSLPGSQLISFSSSSKGLFGVKVLAQIGGTDVTVIASKQEGEASSATFSPRGGAIGQTEERKIADYNYLANQYFYFDHPVFGGPGPDRTDLSLRPIEVWQSVRAAEPEATNASWGFAFVDSFGVGTDIANAINAIENGQDPPPRIETKFILLEAETDYSFIRNFANDEIIGIVMSRAVPDDKTLAVRYHVDSDTRVGGSVRTIGTAVEDTTTFQVFELIKPPSSDHRPTGDYGFVWDYMLRNFYSLGLSNIDPGSLELTIEDRLEPRLDASVPVGSEIPYLRIFGLDQYDRSGQLGSDNIVDYKEGALDLATGILQFPSRRPFAPDTSDVSEWTKGRFQFTGEYRAQYDSAAHIYDEYLTNPVEYNQYDIVVRAVSTSKTFQIEAFNIIENSEKVTLDGRKLTRGTDYDINYDTGEVELRGDALASLSPDSKINIDYEFKPFGGGSASSLVGFNTLSHFGESGRFGMTWLYESKRTAVDKPRIGEEPTRAVVGGFNANFKLKSDLLTSLANKLPLVNKEKPSAITFGGEIAASFPDPNTKGEAYVDDFEGAEDSDRISAARRAWWWASPPVIAIDSVTYDTVATAERWDFMWYNIEPDKGLHRRDLNPNLHERENTLVSSLDIEIEPNPPDTAWVGLMTGFAGGGLDLTKGQFIEIWVNDFKPDPSERGGKLRIDMGRINEDFYEPYGRWNDEDRDVDGFAAGLDDSGLDMLFNKLPDALVDREPRIDDEGGVNEDDDVNGDDYDSRRIEGRFTKINGTEKNGVHDTEDIDRSGAMDQINSYFSFEINLDDTAVVDIREEYPNYDGFNSVYHKSDSWRLYRINLSEAVPMAPDGVEPRFDQIRHIRIWFDDVKAAFQTDGAQLVRRFQIAEFKIVGNRWEEDGVRDLNDQLFPLDSLIATTFGIGVISTKTDPVNYNPPIRPNEENEIFDKEQSLFIKFDSLGAQTSIRILKRFAGTGMNLTSYRDINFWVHADPELFNQDLEYYFRMGTNENYYYEVTLPVTANYFDRSTGWSRVMIKLEDLTQLKFGTPDTLSTVRGTAEDLVDTDRSYPIRMVRTPNLKDVRFLFAGVRNTSTTGQVFSGQIWMDDIFVGDVRRDIGYAQRLNVSVDVAGGVLNLNGSWSRTDAEFRALRARRGSGTLNQSYAINARTSVGHFFPLFGFIVPVSVSYNKTQSQPKYVPNSDIEITESAMRDSLETERVTKSFSTSLSRKSSKNPLLKYTIGKMTTNFSLSETKTRSPSARDTSRAMSGKLGYNISWTKPKNIRLYKKYKIRYWINSLSFNMSATRRTNRRSRFLNGRFVKDPFNFDAKLNLSGSANYSPFRSLSTAFNMSMARDVNLSHEVFGVDVGLEVSRNQTFKMTYKPPKMRFFDILAPDFSYSSNYREDSSPNVRRVGDPKGTRKVSNSRTATLKMKLDAGKHFGQLFDKIGLREEEKQSATGSPPSGSPELRTGARVGRPQNVPTASGADTAVAAPDTVAADTGGPRADPMIALRKLGTILSDIRRVDINVRQTAASSYNRIPERPSVAYQLGLKPDAGIVTKQGPVGDPDRTTTNLTLTMKSGVKITDNIDVSSQYTTTFTNSATEASESESRSTSWPDFSVSWKGLEQAAFFRSIFTIATANLNYKKTSRESGRKDLVDNKNESLSITPSMVLTWKNGINTTLTTSYVSNSSDTRGNETETNQLQINLDFKKELQAGAGFKLPIPFFSKQVRWKSRLNTAIGVSYSRTGGKRSVAGSDYYTPVPITTSFGMGPTLTYNFSKALNGRFFIDYGRSYTERSDQTTTTVRVGISAVFTF